MHFCKIPVLFRLLLILLVTDAVTTLGAQEDADAGGVGGAAVGLHGLDFSRNGALVATIGDAVRVFDVKTGELKREFRTQWTRSVAFSPREQNLIAIGGVNGSVRLWNLAKPQPPRKLVGHTGDVMDVEFSPDGKLLVTTSVTVLAGKKAKGQLHIWDTNTGQRARSVEKKGGAFAGPAFSPDGKRLAVAHNTKPASVTVYSVDTWKPIRRISFGPGFALSMAFAPNGKQLVISGGDCVPLKAGGGCHIHGSFWIADPNSDEPARLIRPPDSGYFRSPSFTPKGDRFAIGTTTTRWMFNDLGVKTGGKALAEIQMYDAKTGALLWTAEGESAGDTYGVTVSRDGKLVGACSGSKVLLIDAKTGAVVRTIPVE